MKVINTRLLHITLIAIGIASVYAIAAISLFPSLRIPCKWISPANLGNVNEVLLSLSLAYISAYIFWILTIRIKDWQNRRKYKWWIYDQLFKLVEIERDIETLIGKDKAYEKEDLKRYLLDSEEHETNRKELEKKLDNLANEAQRIVNMNLPWDDVELELFADLYNYCFMAKEKLGDISDNQIKCLFDIINGITDATNSLEKHANKNSKK